MDRTEIQAALRQIGEAMHDQFPGARERLAQLDSHLATVAMVVDHTYEEDVRAAQHRAAVIEAAIKAAGG